MWGSNQLRGVLAPLASSPVVPDEARRGNFLHDSRVSTPLAGVGVYAVIRALEVAIAAFLLPRGRFHYIHKPLWNWMTTSFDASYFHSIAAHGYIVKPGSTTLPPYTWFPGYPASIDTIAWLPGMGVARAGMVVTFAAGLAAAWGLVRLGLALTGDRRISVLMVALWCAAPGCLVLSMMYSEALFCALAVWTLVALVERRWLGASVLTILAGLTRNTALALIAAVSFAALAALIQAARTRQPFAVWWRPLAAALSAPFGLVGYSTFVGLRLHRADGLVWLEKYKSSMFFDWGVSTWHVIERTVIGGWAADVMLSVVIIIVALALTAWSLTERVPAFLHAYTVVVVVMAVMTNSFYLGSKPRFLVPAVLLSFPVARVLAQARTRVLIPLICLLVAASTWFGLFIMSVGWAP
jgi:hypothetical protein